MAYNKSEQKFWHSLQKAMGDEWMFTRHENGGLSPGVPDLHYVMKDENPHRVGWLELKATGYEISKSNRIKVEPSQHQYMRRWLPYMPIHFLIQVSKFVYLIDAKHAAALSLLDSPNTICAISEAIIPVDRIAIELPPLLKKITRI